MTLFLILTAGILIAVGMWVVVTYNAIIALKNDVARVWSNIDVLLKQRHDELPKLIEVCKQYRQFEQETLEKVVKARSLVHSARERQDIGALGAAEGLLRSGLGSIFAIAEQYPDLKANQQFSNLQTRISELENSIADRRETYNEAVRIWNTKIEQFPDSFVAAWFEFRVRSMLQFSEAETADVDVTALFKA